MSKKKCDIIDCKMLFDAIRDKEDEIWLSGMILILKIPTENKYKLGQVLIKNKRVFDWFADKLYEGGDSYA